MRAGSVDVESTSCIRTGACTSKCRHKAWGALEVTQRGKALPTNRAVTPDTLKPTCIHLYELIFDPPRKEKAVRGPHLSEQATYIICSRHLHVICRRLYHPRSFESADIQSHHPDRRRKEQILIARLVRNMVYVWLLTFRMKKVLTQ